MSEPADLYQWLRDNRPPGRTANAFEAGAMRRLSGGYRREMVYNRRHEIVAESAGWDAMDEQLATGPVRCNHCAQVVPKGFARPGGAVGS